MQAQNLLFPLREIEIFQLPVTFRRLRRKVVKKKTQDDVNDAKLEVIVKNLDTLNSCLFVCYKQTGSCLIIRCITVPGTVISAMEFHGFCVKITMLPLLTLKKML